MFHKMNPNQPFQCLKPLALQLAVEARQLVVDRKDAITLVEESFAELGEQP